jgi:hypothetical protein
MKKVNKILLAIASLIIFLISPLPTKAIDIAHSTKIYSLDHIKENRFLYNHHSNITQNNKTTQSTQESSRGNIIDWIMAFFTFLAIIIALFSEILKEWTKRGLISLENRFGPIVIIQEKSQIDQGKLLITRLKIYNRGRISDKNELPRSRAARYLFSYSTPSNNVS